MESYTNIGKLTRTHGLNGVIILRVDQLYTDDLMNTEKIFVEHHGQKIPYFLENIKNSNPIQIKLEDISNPEEAHNLTNKTLYLRDDDVTAELEHISDLVHGELLHFDIFNKENIFIGKIENVLSYPQQEMALIFKDKKEILIPLVEDFFVSVDIEKQKVIMVLPNGMLNL